MISAKPRYSQDSTVSRRAVLAGAVAGIAASTLAACGFGTKQMASTSGTTDGTRRGAVGLAIIGIITADLDRSLRFYRLLGLQVPTSHEGESYRLRLGDHHTLFWESHAAIKAFDPGWRPPPPGDRRAVLEFGFATADDLDVTYRALTTHGSPGRLAPFDLGGGIRYAIVTDPDGNQISLRHPAT